MFGNMRNARKQIRLKNYDYSLNGYYFVTVCSRNRENIFGEYKNLVGAGLVSARNNIKLSIIGKIIDNQWNNIPKRYENVEFDQYIIMPNHIHGILVINNNGINNREETSPSPTVFDIICSFKSKCSMEYLNYLKQNNMYIPVNIWQRSFYDHIIRNERSLNAIREYISNNPVNWERDIDNLINIE
ncbi:MAG: transposase [Candidatus Omnitrophota bacterium]